MASRQRLTYLPPEVAERFPFFITELGPTTEMYVQARVRDYSLVNIIKILYSLRQGETNFSELHIISKIIMKKSFLSYLHFLMDRKWIEKRPEGINVIYSLTDKGRSFLELI